MPWVLRWLNCDPSARNEPPPKSNNASPATTELGLKLLYAGIGPQIDIVAVHGANAHCVKSWTATNGVNWLRDLLPLDLPQTMIYTWGYDSNGGHSLEDISRDLIRDLQENRAVASIRGRPIIFIAHSLGGLIVKSALLYSASAQDGPEDYTAIRQATYGVLFAGTLELGPSTSGLEALVATSHNSGISQTAPRDPIFKEACFTLTLLREYARISGNFKTVYVRERVQIASSQNSQLDTSVAESLTKLESANAASISINASHGNMIKFGSSSDDGYLKFKDLLTVMARDAGEKLRLGTK